MEKVYRVYVDEEVKIDCLPADAPIFDEALNEVIHRESIAIERFLDNAHRGTLKGTFYFASLNNARSYALMNLQAAEKRIAANMNRLLDYDGS